MTWEIPSGAQMIISLSACATNSHEASVGEGEA